MKQLALTALSVVALALSANAQGDRYWGQPDMPYIESRGFSLGLNFGLADMWGDVGTKSPIDHYTNKKYWNDPHFMGGIFVRYNHVPGLAFRLGLNHGKLYADDRWNEEYALVADNVYDDYVQRYLRNLNVKTTIWEANFMVELSPMRLFSDWEFGKGAKSKWQPYLLLGASFFRYNPQGLYQDFVYGGEQWVDLRPLRTEGQGYNLPGMPDVYSQFNYAVIAGLGVKYDLGRMFGIGLEFQMRHTFTDYLDDASGKYIDPIYHNIAHVNNPREALRVNNMMDKSYAIMPGYQNAAGTFRADPDNKDMFSTISIMFYWKIDKKALPWWNSY